MLFIAIYANAQSKLARVLQLKDSTYSKTIAFVIGINTTLIKSKANDLLRHLNNNVYQPNQGVRYMARLEKAVKSNPNIFDQNRISVGAAYEVGKNIKFTLAVRPFFICQVVFGTIMLMAYKVEYLSDVLGLTSLPVR